jgi:hypothetical protein
MGRPRLRWLKDAAKNLKTCRLYDGERRQSTEENGHLQLRRERLPESHRAKE